MRKLIFKLIVVLSVFSISCSNNNTKEKELELKERELALKEKELNQREKQSLESQPSNLPESNNVYEPAPAALPTKYIYVFFKVEQPELKHTDRKSYTTFDSNLPKVIPEVNYLVPELHTYKSDIVEVENYSDDKKYQYQDKIQTKLSQELSITDMNFRNHVFVTVSDSRDRDEYSKEVCKIIDTKAYVFDTYKEASVHRSNNTDGK